jgi:hypothetical protein
MKKYAPGGYMTPEDVAEEKAAKMAATAYDKAMPDPDTTFSRELERLAARHRRPGRYDSIRPEGFESKIKSEKMDALKKGVSGAGQVAKQTALAAIPGGLGLLVADPLEGGRGAKKMRGAYDKYQASSEKQDAADREMADQVRRESRGVEYKKGGKVSKASSRADGIAQKGKTKGRFV